MSKSIDERIVQMKFDNDKFESGVKETMESLKKLKKETDFKDLQDSASKVNLSNVTNEVDKIGKSFKALDVIKFSVFNNIGNDIYNGFKEGLSKIPHMIDNVFGIIKSKGWSRAANLENAEFQLDNLGIGWERVSKQIDNAVSGTAYGLDSAAKAASQLAASGVKIGQDFKFSKVINEDVDAMERALGAISGLAAMSGRSYDDIAEVFIDTAAKQKATGDTFSRLSERGINATATFAKSIGVTEAKVQEMARKGQISFQDFADAMYEAYYESAKKSNDTFDGAFANMQFALGKIGAEFAKPIRKGLIDPFNEVRQTINRIKSEMSNSGLFEYFTKLTMIVSKLFSNFVSAFRQNDENFKWVGNLTKAFQSLVEVVLKVVVPIKDAFKSVFGDSIIKSINSVTESFANFMKSIEPSAETMGYIKLAFEGIFSVIKNLISIIGKLISGIAGLNLGGTSLLGWIGKALAIGLKLLGMLTDFLDSIIDVKAVTEGLSFAINTLVKYLSMAAMAIGGGFVYLLNNAYEIIRDFITFINSKAGAASTNPVVILIREIVDKAKQIPKVFPELIDKIKEFIKSFTGAETINEKFKVLFGTLGKFKTKIGDVISGISESIKKLGEDTMLTKVISTVVKAIGVIIQNVGTFAALLGTVIVGALSTAVEAIKSFFTTLSENIQKFNGNVIIAFWKTMTEGIKNFVSNIPNALSGIGKFFSELDILDKIKNKFSDFITWLSTAFTKIKDGFSKIKDAFSTLGLVKVYAADFNESVDSIAGSSNKTKWNTEGIQAFNTKLQEFIENGGIAKLAILGINGALFAAMIQFAKFLKSISTVSDGLNSFLRSVTSVIKSVGKKGILGTLRGDVNSAAKDKVKLNDLAMAMLKLSASIGILVASLYALTKIVESPNIKTAGIVFASMAGGILVFTTALAILNKVCNLSFLKSFGYTLVLIAASVLILTKALNNIDTSGGLMERVKALAILSGLLVGVSFLLSKAAPKLWKGSLSLLAFASVIKVFSTVLDKVPNMELNIKDFYEFGATIFLMATLFEVTFRKFSRALANMAQLVLSIAIAAGILTGAVMLIGNYEGDVKKGVKVVGALLALVTIFGLVASVVTKYLGGRMPKFNASLLMIAGAVALLGLVAIKLGEVDEYQLWQGVSAVTVFLSLITLMFIASQATEKAHPLKFATSLVLITGCIVALTGLAVLAGKIKQEELWGGMTAIASFIGLISLLMLASMFTEKANTGAIIASIVAITVIFSAILLLATFVKDWTPVLKALGVMSLVMLAFSSMMKKIGSGRYDAGTVGALLSCTALMIAVAGSLYLLAMCVDDWKKLIMPMIAIDSILGLFIGIFAMIGKIKYNKASMEALLSATVMLAAIAGSLWLLSQNNWLQIAVATAAILVAFFGLAKIFEMISNQSYNLANLAAFAAATLSLIPITLSLNLLAQNNWMQVAAAGGAMFLAILAISNALSVLASQEWGKLLAAAVTIPIVAAGMLILANAIQGFIGLQWEDLGKAGAALGGLTLALLALGLVGEVVLIGAAALALAAASILIAAYAMQIGAVAFNMFIPALELFNSLPIGEIAPKLNELGSALGIFALGGVALGMASLAFIAAALYMGPLADGLTKLSNVGDLSHLPGPLALIGAAGLALGLAAPGMGLASIAIKSLSGSITLLSKAIDLASTAISKGVTKITTSLLMLANTVGVVSKTIGKNVVAGLTSGISEGLPTIVKDGISLASGLIDSIKKKLEIHSPSKVMQWLGNMCGVGFDEGSTDIDVWNGIKAKISSRLEESVIKPAAAAATKVKSAFSGLKDAIASGNWTDKLPTNIKNLAAAAKEGYENGNMLDSMVKSLLGDEFDLSKITEGATSAFGDFSESLAGEGGAAGAAKETQTELEKLTDTISNQMDIFSKFEKKEELTSDTLLENMKSQIKGVQDWSYMMGELGIRGIDKGLLQKLANLGPQGYEYVNAFVKMTDEQLSEANKLYVQSLTIPAASASFITGSFETAGMWATQGFENGLDIEKFRKSGVEGAEAVRDGLEGQNGLQIHSPSRVMIANGQYTVMGLIQGIADKSPNLKAKLESMARLIIYTFKTISSPDEMFKIGENVVQGLIDGMASKQAELEEKAKTLASLVASSTSKTLKIKSPSRVMMKLGGYVSEGLAIGISNNSDLVKSSTDNLANTAIKGLKNAVKAASDMANIDIDTNPTITPVLDLSNIKSGSEQINALTDSWSNTSIGLSTNLANTTANKFNQVSMAKANIALETQNSADLLRSAINALSSADNSGITQNNTFNISGDDPRAIADEVSRVLQMQVERRGAVWA